MKMAVTDGLLMVMMRRHIKDRPTRILLVLSILFGGYNLLVILILFICIISIGDGMG